MKWPNPHSITVDPMTGNVFVPLAGNTTAVGGSACAPACLAVFVNDVPEPASPPILLLGGDILLTLEARRRSVTNQGRLVTHS